MRPVPLWLLLAACSAPGAATDPSLMVHLPFDGTLDDTAPGSPATTVAGLEAYTTDRDGKALSAVSLDGAQVIETGVVGPSRGDASYAFWIRQPHASQQVLFTQRAECTYEKPLEVTVNAGEIIVTYMNGSRYWRDPTNYRRVRGHLSDGEWTHVVHTRSWDHEHGALYVDGERVDAGPIETAFYANPDTPLVIGQSACVIPLFAGDLDDFRVYDRVLTDEEIRAFAR